MINFSDVVGAGEETRTFGTKLSTLIKDRQVLMVLEKVLGHLFNGVGFSKENEMAFFFFPKI